MDVAFILDRYFKGKENVSIDVFDAQTLDAVYRDVLKAMTSHFDIEVSVLQALSYCLYEMMDNVHIHSGKPLGTAMTHYNEPQKVLRILIADGKGMGFGLYTTSRLVDSIGQEFILHSGSHKLIINDGKTSVIEEEIDPNQIVDYRTDAAGEFNELFVETGELESLW